MMDRLRVRLLDLLERSSPWTWLGLGIGGPLLILMVAALVNAVAAGRIMEDVRIAPAAAEIPWTAAERALVSGMRLARAPFPPPPPPVQVAPPFAEGVLSLPVGSERRTAFLAATRLLRGLRPEDAAAAPRLDRTGCPDALLRAEAEGRLPTADDARDSRAGMINYHLGVARLCAGDPVGAAGNFERAADPIARARGALRVDHARQPLLAQYEVARIYGLALARAGWPGDTELDPETARAVDALLQQAAALAHAEGVAAPPQYGKAGAFRDFGSQRAFQELPLFDFGSGHILAARLWVMMRTPGGYARPPEGLANWMREAAGDRRTPTLPALTANLPVALLALPGEDGDKPQRHVQRLHRLYANAEPSARVSGRAADRLRAMAAMAGADVGSDGSGMPDDGRDESAFRLACTEDGRSAAYPAIVLEDSAKAADDDPDSLILDRYLCVRAMREAARLGEASRFAAAHRALRTTAGALDEQLAAVVREVGAPFANRLLTEAQRLRDVGREPEARALDSILADGALFGWSIWLPAQLRLWFGTGWPRLFLGTLLIMAASVLAWLTGVRLREALRAIDMRGHHRDRMGVQTA